MSNLIFVNGWNKIIYLYMILENSYVLPAWCVTFLWESSYIFMSIKTKSFPDLLFSRLAINLNLEQRKYRYTKRVEKQNQVVQATNGPQDWGPSLSSWKTRIWVLAVHIVTSITH